MNYYPLVSLFKTSVVLHLLDRQQKAFIIAFLYQVFKENAKSNEIEESYFLRQLRNFIDTVNELQILAKSPEDWLREWLSVKQEDIEIGGYVKRRTDYKTNTNLISLAAETEMVFRWVEILMEQSVGQHVATESRFMDIFNKIREIIDKSETKPEEKLKQLQTQRNEIDKQIAAIQQGNNDFETFDSFAIIERFTETKRMTKDLLGDFSQVEVNFKLLINDLYKQKLHTNYTQGGIMGYTISSIEELKENPQGRSFYGFRDFLSNLTKQDELKQNVEKILQLPDIAQQSEKDKAVLENLIGNLFDAKKQVENFNQQLLAELERAVSEKNMRENKQVAALLNDIKKLAIEQINENELRINKKFIEIETKPVINLLLERDLNLSQEEYVTKKYDIVYEEEKVNEINEQFTKLNLTILRRFFRKKRVIRKKRLVLSSSTPTNLL
jgi:hypothetical protein